MSVTRDSESNQGSFFCFGETHGFCIELRRSLLGSDTLQDTHRPHPPGRPAPPRTQLHARTCTRTHRIFKRKYRNSRTSTITGVFVELTLRAASSILSPPGAADQSGRVTKHMKKDHNYTTFNKKTLRKGINLWNKYRIQQTLQSHSVQSSNSLATRIDPLHWNSWRTLDSNLPANFLRPSSMQVTIIRWSALSRGAVWRPQSASRTEKILLIKVVRVIK